MKKYWMLSIGFFSVLLVSTVIIRFTATLSGQVLGESTSPTINPTEYIRKITAAAERKLTPKPTEVRRNANPNASGLLDNLKAGTTDRKLPLATPSGALAAKKEATKARLNTQKLKICQEKSNQILSRSNHMLEMVSSAEAKFTSVATAVKTYYATKNLTLVSYDELASSIETKKASLSSLIAVAKADIANFSCSGENPSAHLKKYQEDMKAVLTALNEYRTAIHTLIQAIKEVVPTVTPVPTQI